MKKLLLVLALLFISSNSSNSAFCEGYKVGYPAGYCYDTFGCIAPMTPMCPMPSINQTSWEDGYNRGFIDGRNDRR